MGKNSNKISLKIDGLYNKKIKCNCYKKGKTILWKINQNKQSIKKYKKIRIYQKKIKLNLLLNKSNKKKFKIICKVILTRKIIKI